VETLTAVTPVLVRTDHGMPDFTVLRTTLRRWAFNPPHRDDDMPADIRAALSWIKRVSLPLTALQDDKIVRQVLDMLALKLDGTAASPDYLGRRRRVLYNILKYAVREGRLTENPLDTTEWEPPDSGIDEINPRVVASPEQVRQLLTAVSHVGPRRGGEGARAAEREPERMMTVCGPLQARPQPGRGGLVDLTEEGQRHMPGIPAGPAQVGSSGPERPGQGVELIEHVRGRGDGHEQPHQLTGRGIGSYRRLGFGWRPAD